MSAVDRDHLKIFAGRASIDLADAVSQHLMLPTGQGMTELFPDGELIVRVVKMSGGGTASSCNPPATR